MHIQKRFAAIRLAHNSDVLSGLDGDGGDARDAVICSAQVGVALKFVVKYAMYKDGSK